MSQSQSPIIIKLGPSKGSQDSPSRLGLAGSVLLHLAVIAATLFSWQHRLDIPDQSPPVVPVDLVTIAAKTNLRQVAPAPQKFTPKAPQPIQAQPVQDTPPPLPQQVSVPSVPMPLKAPKVETPPPPAISTTAPAIKMRPQPPHIVPHLRPRPPRHARAHEQPKHTFNINSVLALLNKQKPAASSAKGVTGAHPHRGFGAQNAMTMELADALRNEIAQCWSPPVGAPNPTDLVVVFELFLNPDGSVARPPQLAASSAAAATNNPFTQAAAEAARRAIYTCAPFKLPADKYNQWRDIDIQFDPRQMMGDQ